jgi:hypothetical protein
MTLDKQRSTPIGPFILHVNVAQGVEGKSAIIGLSQDAPNFSSASHEEGTPEFESVKANARSVTKPVPESRKAKEKVARKDEEQARKKEQDKKEKSKKEKASPEAKTESRPRRVG